MKRIITLLAVLQLLIASQGAFGQGWVRIFPTALNNGGINPSGSLDIVELNNGNILTSWYMFGPYGELLKQYFSDFPFCNSVYVPTIRDFYLNSDGTVMIAGNCSGNYFIGKMDAFGNILWTKNFRAPDFCYSYFADLEVNADGTYSVAIMQYQLDSFQSCRDYFAEVWTLDTNGDSLFYKSFGISSQIRPNSVSTTPDSGYFALLEYPDSLGIPHGWTKFNSTWDTVWTSQMRGYIGIPNELGYMTASAQGDTIYVSQYDVQGSYMHDLKFSIDTSDAYLVVRKIARYDDGGYYILAENQSLLGYTYPIILRFDEQGNEIVWANIFDNPLLIAYPSSAVVTNDGGFIINGVCDFRNIPGPYNEFGFLIKTDSLGRVFSTFINGKVFLDDNLNCTIDSTEIPLARHMVIANPLSGNYPPGLFVGLTDSNGNYEIGLDSGYYSLDVPLDNGYWSLPTNCDSLYNGVIFRDLYDTTLHNLPLKVEQYCPYLTVHISAPWVRRCLPSKYTVSYCNQGIIPVDSAYVEIELDPLMQFDNSSIPWDTSGGLYVFQLGDLAIGECGTFTIDVTYDPTCTETVLGQTACVEAHIYPDSICTPLDPAWDGSTMEVEAICENEDTVRLLARNSGTNPTSAPRTITIIEDNVMLTRLDSIFAPSQKREWTYAANGKTYAIMAKQSEGHPLLSTPIAAVEGCGVDSLGNISLGFITPLPPGDEDPFIDIDCQPNSGSYDPNDKTPTPLGVGMEGYISQGQKLDYKIRFQNTGTDTAFNIWIRDLPQELDITTLQLGASSHTYTVKIQPGRVLEWTFLNILLPDSNVNEPASHGFVQFSIQQADSLVPGTTIENSAAIFFDFNAPVITNTTLNTIVEDFTTKLDTVDIGTGTIQNIEEREEIKIYPNPNQGAFTIQLEQLMSELTFTIYDAAGKQLMVEQFYHQQKLLINNPNYGSGLYFYELTGPDGLVARGKIIMQ